MEVEIMQTVLTEVLEELKELKQQLAKSMAVVLDLNNKVDDFELKLNKIKVTAPATNLEPITSAVNEGLLGLAPIVGEQPKSVTRQFRILLFPEQGAREYYRIVFGRVLFWITVLLVATYLFVLAKEFINGHNVASYQEAKSDRYKKAWNYLYRSSRKGLRGKMDTVLMKSYSN
jgi:hypothetical protein